MCILDVEVCFFLVDYMRLMVEYVSVSKGMNRVNLVDLVVPTCYLNDIEHEIR